MLRVLGMSSIYVVKQPRNMTLTLAMCKLNDGLRSEVKLIRYLKPYMQECDVMFLKLHSYRLMPDNHVG